MAMAKHHYLLLAALILLLNAGLFVWAAHRHSVAHAPSAACTPDIHHLDTLQGPAQVTVMTAI